ncbi:hypothetical protein J5X98_23525 [Leptothermofonsia sichuanensis E412]|uniref:hypothetical protein n=1 Tax=Leptothermofonsia sichuanensis TaxID=2917832 RepID=UPI001CA7002C|nr:hypothetical protein [Leptothermofonsia sichuanensis]QZZ20204.1 hypothetical protein J5X98_23525 [Leptothermofonsia sichuanensis E412]
MPTAKHRRGERGAGPPVHARGRTDRYRIRVVFQSRGNETTQTYAIAWWTMPVPSK